MTRPRQRIFSCLFALFFPTAIAFAQHDHGGKLPDNFADPMPLYEKALGDFERPISSKSSEAQAYFNQGFQMMYAFTTREATRSFREAQKRDPNCAICYWAEAWSWGSYLNGPMSEKNAPFAYVAIQKALELAPEHADERERAFIEAMAVRYVEDFDAEHRRDQDLAYSKAMQKLHERYPDDLDAGTLYAESLFLLEPRRGERDVNRPEVKRLHGVLEGVLAKDVRHPGACHLYIHATESTVVPEKAEACSEFIGTSIPGASHINHMPSHTWNEIGRWGDSVRANLMAWHSDLKSDFDEGFAIYPSHNLHMLLFAASMDGQGAVAIQAAADYAELTRNPQFHLLTLVRFGRFDEIFELTERPKSDIATGIWDFAHGYAQLRAGELDFARAHLNRLKRVAESEEMFRHHTACDLLGSLAWTLEGEIRRDLGDLDGAIRAMKLAVSKYDSLAYDEPEPLPFSARHWLGAALVEAGRFADAEQVYREELGNHPHNGWSLLGLMQALDAQGKVDADVEADFEASWARSDTWIRSSRF